ncbi:hypothetical protein Zmor_004407 [Zophobas morio]|uniref:Uncharacterized protein n=1 Tax=Zophobas morio TaxID=2755281 RepID=A0AA38M0A5_9CUCU|nr:hypothetical protein Zmor_004407 [Zophobas morio]
MEWGKGIQGGESENDNLREGILKQETWKEKSRGRSRGEFLEEEPDESPGKGNPEVENHERKGFTNHKNRSSENGNLDKEKPEKKTKTESGEREYRKVYPKKKKSRDGKL